MTRDLNELTVQTKAKVEKLMAMANHDATELGYDELIVTSTYRSFKEQAYLYASSRSRVGPKLTNAKPGESFHNVRRAVDVVWVKDGKAVWDDEAAWYHLSLLAIQCDLTWGGKFKSFQDKPHLQDEWCATCGLYHASAKSFNEDGSCKKPDI